MSTGSEDLPVSEMLKERLQNLKPADLPVLKQTIVELKALSSRQDDITTTMIADVILHDPLMTLKVLSVVNATRRGRFDTELSTIEHGLITLGITPFFNGFNTLHAVEEQLQSYPEVLNQILTLSSRAYHAAYQADSWAMLRMDTKSEEVYIGALLHDIAEIMLWTSDPATAMAVDKLMRDAKLDKKTACQQVLNFGFREFQEAMYEAWHIPQVLKDFVNPDNAIRPRILGALLASSIAKHTDIGWDNANLRADIEVLSSLLHITFEEAMTLVERNAINVARKWYWYNVPPAAKWLPLLQQVSQVKPEQADTQEPPRGSAKLQQTMQAIAERLAEAVEPHDMMSTVLSGMHEGLGLSRVMFALLTPDHTVAKAKYVLGDNRPAGLRQFQFELRDNHLFNNLMCRPQSIWLNTGNRDTFGPLIPNEIRNIIGDGDFFAMSVFVQGKPIGLFYADRRDGPDSLDDISYREFKKLCLRTAQCLGQLAKNDKQLA